MIANPAPLVRVSRAHPCPVCGRPDWCSRSADGALALCMRVSEGSTRTAGNGAHVHRMRADLPPPPPPRRREAPPPPDLRAIIEAAQRQTTDDDLRAHVDALGLPAAGLSALLRLGAHLPRYDADELLRIAPRDAEKMVSLRAQIRSLAREFAVWLCVPMHALGRVVGVRLRHRSGRKLALCGGHEGLFVPNDLSPGDDLICVVEGASDCAALLAIGLPAIGRPSCRGAVDETSRLALVLRPRRVAVLLDADKPGIEGGAALAQQLAAVVGDVRCVLPPKGCKDVRAWVHQGARASDILAAIEGARRVE